MKAKGKALYPFVPSGSDFDAALGFFGALGFEVTWKDDALAGLRFGGAYFLLQNIDVPEWQANQMIVVEVDDLDAYWRDLDGLDLPSRYPGVRLKEPTDFPWGRELHVIDPAGVCWHFRQSAPAAAGA